MCSKRYNRGREIGVRRAVTYEECRKWGKGNESAQGTVIVLPTLMYLYTLRKARRTDIATARLDAQALQLRLWAVSGKQRDTHCLPVGLIPKILRSFDKR